MHLDPLGAPAGAAHQAARDLVEDRLSSGYPVRFHIRTGSMLPTLQPGDQVSVRRAPAGDAPLGAVVMLARGHTWVVHRLIARSPDGAAWRLHTKGDHSPAADPAWENIEWVGIVQSVKRGERTLDLTAGSLLRWAPRLAQLSALEARLNAARPPLRRLHRLPRLGLAWLAGWCCGR